MQFKILWSMNCNPEMSPFLYTYTFLKDIHPHYILHSSYPYYHIKDEHIKNELHLQVGQTESQHRHSRRKTEADKLFRNSPESRHRCRGIMLTHYSFCSPTILLTPLTSCYLSWASSSIIKRWLAFETCVHDLLMLSFAFQPWTHWCNQERLTGSFWLRLYTSYKKLQNYIQSFPSGCQPRLQSWSMFVAMTFSTHDQILIKQCIDLSSQKLCLRSVQS